MNLNRFTRWLFDLDTPCYFNDYKFFTTATNGVSSLAADSGATVAAGATRNGVCICTTGATDNNEAAVFETNAMYTLLANKPISGRALFQYTEAATNAANVFVGFASAPGANLLQDNGAGPRTSGTIIGIYKVDGATVWHAYSRSNSIVIDTTTNKTAGTASAYNDVEIIIGDWDGTSVEVGFKIDGEYLRDTNGATFNHRVAVASATIAAFTAYVKDGSGTGEVLNVDWHYSAQAR